MCHSRNETSEIQTCLLIPQKNYIYMTNMFKTEFLFPPRIPVPALHDGTLRWEDILHGTYEDFQKHHSALGIPTSDGRCLDTPLTLTGSPDCIQQRKSFGISVSDPRKVS